MGEEIHIENIKPYEDACNEIKKILIEILYNFCIERNIDFLICSRIKQEESINNKIKNKGKKINDIVGIRIVFCKAGEGIIANPKENINKLKELDKEIETYTPDELVNIYTKKSLNQTNGDDKNIIDFINLLHQKNIKILNEKDYINNPKKSGYQSYHFLTTASNGITVEIQTRNYLQHLFSAWEHHLYKTKEKGYSIDEEIEKINEENKDTRKI